MGHKHSREEVVDAAVRAALAGGLGGLSFRRVADEAGTSDRMVVYYLPDKARLHEAVLLRLGDDLRQVLATSLPSDAPDRLTRAQVLRASRPVFLDPATRGVMRLFLEAVGLAAAGTPPFAAVVPRIVAEWVGWLEARMGPDAPPGEAAAVVALVDGLVVLGALLGPEAERAAWDAVVADGT